MQHSPDFAVTEADSPLNRLASFLSLTWTLSANEFKLRYSGSVLGYFWSVSKPLMLFGVLYFVFDRILNLGADTPNYPLQLLLGVMLWAFFAEVTSSSVGILVARADLLRKIAFPKLVLPISVSMTAMFAMVFNLLAVFAFVLGSGIRPSPQWLYFIPLLIELYALALGVSLILAALFPRLRDVGQIWEVGLQVLFYSTPIIYPIMLVPAEWHSYVLSNPVAQIVQHSRQVIIGDGGPFDHLAVPVAITVTLLIVGTLLYRHAAPRAAEHV